jgi:hypothetical protein
VSPLNTETIIFAAEVSKKSYHQTTECEERNVLDKRPPRAIELCNGIVSKMQGEYMTRECVDTIGDLNSLFRAVVLTKHDVHHMTFSIVKNVK